MSRSKVIYTLQVLDREQRLFLLKKIRIPHSLLGGSNTRGEFTCGTPLRKHIQLVPNATEHFIFALSRKWGRGFLYQNSLITISLIFGTKMYLPVRFMYLPLSSVKYMAMLLNKKRTVELDSPFPSIYLISFLIEKGCLFLYRAIGGTNNQPNHLLENLYFSCTTICNTTENPSLYRYPRHGITISAANADVQWPWK